MSRKLVTIRKIKEIKPINNADLLELALIDGWQVVVRKNEFNVNDLVVYFEVDSYLPIKPEYEFLRKSSYKNIENKEGFRIRTQKLRGTLSQGLIMHINELPELKSITDTEEGMDLTNVLNVDLYDISLIGHYSQSNIKNVIPSFIPNTSLPRVQNLNLEEINKFEFSYDVTEKIDGTSASFFVYNGEFGLCSANYELYINNADDCDVYNKINKKYSIREKLLSLNKNIVIQGEIVGPGIQKNRLRLTDIDFYIYCIYDVDNKKFYLYDEITDFVKQFNFMVVNRVGIMYGCDFGIDWLLQKANGASQTSSYCDQREGLVYKSRQLHNSVIKNVDTPYIAFKVLSNEYLLKNDC